MQCACITIGGIYSNVDALEKITVPPDGFLLQETEESKHQRTCHKMQKYCMYIIYIYIL